MKVVSNTSPIINLAGVGVLDLLHQLYNNLIIPPAVYLVATHHVGETLGIIRGRHFLEELSPCLIYPKPLC